MTTEVIVIGGGITGLAAAYELARRRVPFVLLEASPRLGGLIQTEHVDGFTIEAGPDSVLVQKPAALDLITELGLASDVISARQPRTAFVLKRGRLHPLPSPSVLGIPTALRGLIRYDLLPPAARARLALEHVVPVSRMPDESVAAFFRRRFGAATVGLVAEPLLGGIHAGDVEALSMHSLFPRFVAAEAARGSVLRAFKGSSAAASGEGLFRSLSGGMGALVSAIGRRLPPGSVRLATPAERVERSGDGWRVGTLRDDLRARAVIVAAPASAASRLLAAIDERVAALCSAIPYASTVSIALAWRRDEIEHALAGSGFVVARRYNDLRVTACTWVSSKWESRAPEGAVLVRAFIGGVHDPYAIDLADDDLVGAAVRDLAPIIGAGSKPMMSRVYRWRNAGAQHNVGQLARMAEIDQRLALHSGLLVAGSGFRAVGIPDCVADGRAAAAGAATYVTIGSR